MKTTKRPIKKLVAAALAVAMLVPVAVSAQTHVFLGVNLGARSAPPPVEVYNSPYDQQQPVYYQRRAYYSPRVAYGEPQVIYYHRGQRSWDYEQRGDFRHGWDRHDDRDWNRDDEHEWHHHGRHDDDHNDH